MANQNNTSRNQANQRRARALEARETKASTSVARANSSPSNAGKVTASAVTRATHATGEALGKAGEAALEMARANPVPLALAGLGVACAGIGVSWLIASHTAGGSQVRHASREREHPDGRRNGVATIRSVTHDATDKISSFAHRAGDKATQLEQQLETMIKDHPIAAGATLLAVGAAIGLAVPRTALEDSWIGHERDRLLTSARNLFQSVMEKGKALAEHVIPDETASGAHA